MGSIIQSVGTRRWTSQAPSNSRQKQCKRCRAPPLFLDGSIDLSRFVETFPRGSQGRWPQDDIGVILWGLSNVADELQSVDTLRAMCAIRDDAVARMHWNAEGTMFVGRILGPLRWFGLLEYRGPPERFEVGWRKSALFDRFLSFDVRFAGRHSEGH